MSLHHLQFDNTYYLMSRCSYSRLTLRLHNRVGLRTVEIGKSPTTATACGYDGQEHQIASPNEGRGDGVKDTRQTEIPVYAEDLRLPYKVQCIPLSYSHLASLSSSSIHYLRMLSARNSLLLLSASGLFGFCYGQGGSFTFLHSPVHTAVPECAPQIVGYREDTRSFGFTERLRELRDSTFACERLEHIVMLCSDKDAYEDSVSPDSTIVEPEVQCVCGELTSSGSNLYQYPMIGDFERLAEECYACMAENADFTGTTDPEFDIFSVDRRLHENEVCKEGQSLTYDEIFQEVDDAVLSIWSETYTGPLPTLQPTDTSDSGSASTTESTSSTPTSTETEADAETEPIPTPTPTPTGGASGLSARGGAAALLAGLAFLM